MEFKEYSNPESHDYDIKSSLCDGKELNGYTHEENQYAMLLIDLIGILEDEEADRIYDDYGITFEEYLNPTAETIEKVKTKLSERETIRK